MRSALDKVTGLDLQAAAVEDLLVEDGRVAGVVDAAGKSWRAGAVVLTTGTFLKGVIHRGEEREAAGRVGEAPSIGLSDRLYGLGLTMGRLKTGTPPRLDGRTIAWNELEMQAGDEPPVPLSFLTGEINRRQVQCGITATTAATHDIIRQRLGESAVYGGGLQGRGPRYCPSIEDKVVRFADRGSHQIFLEPEGVDDPTVYPNGISTSVSAATQDAFLRTIPGLGEVRVVRYGYAIEYDYVDPRELMPSLAGLSVCLVSISPDRCNGLPPATKRHGGAEGLMAGLNAARATAGLSSAILGRDEAYIGVMIDDLVTSGVTEPYRMFTSRAEYRLRLRADNADQRLTPRGQQFGCVGPARLTTYAARAAALEIARAQAKGMSMTSAEAVRAGFKVNADGQKRNLFHLLAHQDITLDALGAIWPEIRNWSPETREQIEIEAAYRGYLDRQQADIDLFRRDEDLLLPAGLDYATLGGLSNEAREKLAAVRPAALAARPHASKSVTPGGPHSTSRPCPTPPGRLTIFARPWPNWA